MFYCGKNTKKNKYSPIHAFCALITKYFSVYTLADNTSG